MQKKTPLLHRTSLEGPCHHLLIHSLSSACTPGTQALLGSAFLCSMHLGNGVCQLLLFEYLLTCCFVFGLKKSHSLLHSILDFQSEVDMMSRACNPTIKEVEAERV